MTGLSPEDKQRILEEERARAEAKEQVAQEMAAKKTKAASEKVAKGCLGCLGLVVVWVLFVAIFAQSASKPAPPDRPVVTRPTPAQVATLPPTPSSVQPPERAQLGLGVGEQRVKAVLMMGGYVFDFKDGMLPDGRPRRVGMLKGNGAVYAIVLIGDPVNLTAVELVVLYSSEFQESDLERLNVLLASLNSSIFSDNSDAIAVAQTWVMREWLNGFGLASTGKESKAQIVLGNVLIVASTALPPIFGNTVTFSNASSTAAFPSAAERLAEVGSQREILLSSPPPHQAPASTSPNSGSRFPSGFVAQLPARVVVGGWTAKEGEAAGIVPQSMTFEAGNWIRVSRYDFLREEYQVEARNQAGDSLGFGWITERELQAALSPAANAPPPPAPPTRSAPKPRLDDALPPPLSPANDTSTSSTQAMAPSQSEGRRSSSELLTEVIIPFRGMKSFHTDPFCSGLRNAESKVVTLGEARATSHIPCRLCASQYEDRATPTPAPQPRQDNRKSASDVMGATPVTIVLDRNKRSSEARYHLDPGCFGMSQAQASDKIPTTMGQAIRQGYSPCRLCAEE